MKFIRMYAVILVLCGIFAFFGGWELFDFGSRYYIATAACAFVISVVATIFDEQGEQIKQLEKRVKELEEKDEIA